MYTVLEYFTDLQDNGYAYKVGDTYPRKGYEPTEERIKELSSGKNVRKRPIIQAEIAAEAAVEEPAEAPEQEKPKRRRKKVEE